MNGTNNKAVLERNQVIKCLMEPENLVLKIETNRGKNEL